MKVVRKKRKFNLKLNKLKINKEPIVSSPKTISETNDGKFKEKKLFKINSHLYMSGYHSAKDLKCLNSHGITHVINLTTHRCPNLHQEKMEYSSFALSDNINFNLLSCLDIIVNTIEAKINEGKRVLVHCKMGISRAPSIVLAFLIMKNKMTFQNAFENLQRINSEISPNFGFLMQLQRVEELTLI